MKLSLFGTADAIRKFVIAFLIFAIVVIAIDIVGRSINPTEGSFVPEISPWQDAPRNGFGTDIQFPKLPALAISSDSQPLFAIRGDFPLAPDTAYIYQIEKPRQKLNSVEKATEVAAKLGFTPEAYQKTSDTTYKWENDRKTRTLVHDIVARTWDFHTVSYFQDADALRTKTTDKTTDYGGRVKAMVKILGFDYAALEAGKTSFDLVKRGSDRFIPITFAEQPEYAVGSVYRKILLSNTKPGDSVKGPDDERITEYFAHTYSDKVAEQGSIYMAVADRAADAKKDVFEFTFTEFEYSNNNSYYYIVKPSVAWQNVQLGQGTLMQLIPQGKSKFDPYQTVAVRKFTAEATQTELAYLEPQGWTGFLYPMFIFRGTAELADGGLANFVFYIDALRR